MSSFLRRLRPGSDAGPPRRLLGREGKDGDGRGPTPPATAADGTGAPRLAGPLSNSEVSVLLRVDNTMARRDRRTGRALAGQQKALVAAAHASVGADSDLEEARAHPRWRNGAAAASAQAAAAAQPGQGDGRLRSGRRLDKRAFREMFDPHEPLVTGRALLIVELVFVAVELTFWYNVFSGNLQPGEGLTLAKVGDIMLAVLLPLSGIVSARVVGGLMHRAISWYPGVGYKEIIGALVSGVVAGLAVYAIYSLVSARYGGAAQLGSAPLPARAMTLVFVVVLLGDMLARVFLVSEIRAQTAKWLREVRRLKVAALRASQRHCEAWLDLRNSAQMELDYCEQIVTAGARIISDRRSRDGGSAPRVPPGLGADRRHAHEDPATRRGGRMRAPSVVPLQLYDVHLALGPVRVVEDAVDALREWPPRGLEGLAEHLNDVLSRLHHLKFAIAAITADATRPRVVDAVTAPGTGPLAATPEATEQGARPADASAPDASAPDAKARGTDAAPSKAARGPGDGVFPMPPTTPIDRPRRQVTDVDGVDLSPGPEGSADRGSA